MARLAEILRYPIKAVGREAVHHCSLNVGETLPGDRMWAVAHEASKAVDGEWARCMGFVRAASSPQLMAVTCRSEGAVIHLSHPQRPDIAINPECDADTLITWLEPLIAAGRAQPARLLRAPEGRGMTDTSAPSITLGSLTSHAIVAKRLGHAVSHHRWRCNLWIEGMAPWAEFDLIGRNLRIGDAEFTAYKRIERCEATAANPETGQRDADLLNVLETVWEHQDFTVGLKVVKAGDIRIGDTLEIL